MALMAFHASLSLGMSLGNTMDESSEDEAELLHLLNQNHLEKRKFGPQDPRSLFSQIYSNYNSNYRKRNGPDPDPRSLFSQIYSNYNGGNFRKRYTAPEPEDLYYVPARMA